MNLYESDISIVALEGRMGEGGSMYNGLQFINSFRTDDTRAM